MTIWQAIILGIVQGLTEFLPISSSAHLVLVPEMLGWDFAPEQSFPFFVLVQWGTLLAVLAYFWSDLLPMGQAMLRSLNPARRPASDEARLGWLLILATLPVIGFGFFFQASIRAAFDNPQATGFFLLLTAALLLIAEAAGRRQRHVVARIGARTALSVGFFQVLALLPGVSRSGATISGGMLRQLDRPAAARFSFLMAVPAMVAAGALELFELTRLPGSGDQIGPLLAGLLAAALVGYLSIRWLLGYIANHSYRPFVFYCTVAGLLAIIYT
jgi:undecaprenyl-diphosphatase